MAQTRVGDVADQIPELWAADLFSQAESLTFWHSKEGPEGSTMPIVRKDDLAKQAGDTIKYDIVLALTGDGQAGDTTSLEGNEEELKFRQTSLVVTQLSHAVRWTELTEILMTHDMRSSGLRQLRKWLAGKYDDGVWAEFTGNTNPRTSAVGTTIPDANKWAAGTATTRAGVADTNAGGRLTLDTITELKAYAQTELKIEPIRLEDGNEYFGLASHPYAIMQLKRDDTKWAQAQREAQVRGDDNPLFTGAAGVWDGVILFSNERTPRSTNGSIQVADNVFFGAQAMSRGYAYYPDWREEEFDYGRSIGIATISVHGEKINVFDLTAAGGAAASALTAIGHVVLYSAAVAPGQP